MEYLQKTCAHRVCMQLSVCLHKTPEEKREGINHKVVYDWLQLEWRLHQIETIYNYRSNQYSGKTTEFDHSSGIITHVYSNDNIINRQIYTYGMSQIVINYTNNRVKTLKWISRIVLEVPELSPLPLGEEPFGAPFCCSYHLQIQASHAHPFPKHTPAIKEQQW